MSIHVLSYKDKDVAFVESVTEDSKIKYLSAILSSDEKLVQLGVIFDNIEDAQNAAKEEYTKQLTYKEWFDILSLREEYYTSPILSEM